MFIGVLALASALRHMLVLVALSLFFAFLLFASTRILEAVTNIQGRD